MKKVAQKELKRRVCLSPQLELCPGFSKKKRRVAQRLLGSCWARKEMKELAAMLEVTLEEGATSYFL